LLDFSPAAIAKERGCDRGQGVGKGISKRKLPAAKRLRTRQDEEDLAELEDELEDDDDGFETVDEDEDELDDDFDGYVVDDLDDFDGEGDEDMEGDSDDELDHMTQDEIDALWGAIQATQNMEETAMDEDNVIVVPSDVPAEEGEPGLELDAKGAEPVGEEAEEVTVRIVDEATVMPMRRVWQEDVVSRLPYREVQRPCGERVNGVMVDDQRVILVAVSLPECNADGQTVRETGPMGLRIGDKQEMTILAM
jgi:hypothetical protein